MNKITQFEDLSNDLFLEIFEYFHALDLFMAFASLNNRISSIVSFTRLHVVISKLHCRYQVIFLSSHLTHHAHQVVSVSIQDELRDLPSAISFIFDRHTFENLQSCKFNSIHPLTKLHNAMNKLENLNKLVSVQIIQPNDRRLSDTFEQQIAKTILMHRSLQLRTIDLTFRYSYPKLVTTIALNLTVTSLRMHFHGSTVSCSIYSLLPILRHYRSLRVLRISIVNDDSSDTQQVILPTLPITYENNPPILSSITTFELNIQTSCDFRSLDFILHCMPNLRRFMFTFIYSSLILSWCKDLFDGYKWQQLLTKNTSHLDVFDISLLIYTLNFELNVDHILKSFDYFARKYDDWYLAIHQSRYSSNKEEQQIALHGYRCSKKQQYFDVSQVGIVMGTLNVYSTRKTDIQDHLFYSHLRDLRISIPVNIKNCYIPPSGPLFKNLDYLTIEMDSSKQTFWDDILNLFNISCNVSESDQKEHVDKLTSLIDLTNIIGLEIQPKNNTSHLYFIKEILLASPCVTQLKIGNLLLFSPILYDNLSLIPIFNRLESLYLLTGCIRFPLKYAQKIVERFPSLIHLELEVYSVDMSISLLDILLDGLPKLVHLKIHFRKNKLWDDETCLINHVIETRCRAFPHDVYNQDEIHVKTNEKIMDIYLGGCSLCAKANFII